MKKTLILLLMACCAGLKSNAQQLQFPEPEFIGYVLAVLPDDTTEQLVQESLAPRHRSSVGETLFGIGRSHISEMTLKGPKSASRLTSGDGTALIVRVLDNNIDPMSEITVFRFETNKKYRIAEYASEGTLGAKVSNTLERQPFTARKFGNSSYMIILKDPQPGEYGITLNAPGNLNVATFGIDK